ncbi:MAG TPA: hypothetical protein VMM38_01260 [Aridibacter sp.]|nr:hypothetical protein [Aridibacter sp.]
MQETAQITEMPRKPEAVEAPSEPPKEKEQTEQIYDAEARNRFAYRVRHGGAVYDTAHIFEPVSDDRYMQWLRAFRIRGDESNIQEETNEATLALWEDLIVEVENVESSSENWKAQLPFSEKIESVQDYLAVAVADGAEEASGKRILTDDLRQVVFTEAYFNGKITRQKHTLREPTFEQKKKYARVEAKRWRQERTKGLKRKPRVEFVPQDEKLGDLYDELLISVEGFARDIVPLRFKTTVVDEIFAGVLDEKK